MRLYLRKLQGESILPLHMIKAMLFYLVFGILLATGAALAMAGKGIIVLLIGVAAYVGLFIKYGCLSH